MSYHSNFWRSWKPAPRYALLCLPLLLLCSAFGQPATATAEKPPIRFVKAFSSDADAIGARTPCQRLRDLVNPSAAAGNTTAERPAICDQALNVVAGRGNPLDEDITAPIQAGRLVVDLRQRILISEPTSRTVHILDFAHRKYLRIKGAKGDHMEFPYAIAIDANNNIYVTDLTRGRIAVYNPDGKFKKYLGTFKGEGMFQYPRSIAIDRETGRIYLADSTRGFLIILDSDGKTLAEIGKRGGGSGPGEFVEPTEVAIYKKELFVLDKRNFRIQVFDLDGQFQRQFALEGSGVGEVHGMAFDAQGRLLVSSSFNWIDVFDQTGKLLFRFGQSGDQPGEFNETRGISTDDKNRAYVIDAGNRRIQIFQILNQPEAASMPHTRP